MSKLIFIVFIPVFITGCAGNSGQSSNVPASYFSQQAYADRTPMELWVEMRHESEIKDDITWVSKLKQMEAAADAKKQPRAKLAKNKKDNQSGKTEVASE